MIVISISLLYKTLLCARLMARLISATATSRDLNKTYVALINIYITSYTLHIALVFFLLFSHTLFYNDKNEIYFFYRKISYNSCKLSLFWKNSTIVQFI